MADVPKTVSLTTRYSLPTIGFGVYQLEASLCPEAVENALKAGYRHIDCAQYYQNEAEVGEGVRRSGIPRDQVFITSKVYRTTVGYDKTLKSVERSVKKLGFSYYDLFLVHSPHGRRNGRLARYRALLEAKNQGLVRTVGVSNFSEKHIKEIEEAGLEKPAVNQIELHPWCQQRPIVSYCQSEGIVVQAYSPLVRGNEAGEGKGIKNAVVLGIADKHGKSPAQVLIRWSLQKGLVPLPKATLAHRIEENFKVFDFTLDAEDVAAIDALDEGASGAVTWNPVDEP
ncbi:NADP-dependent oxidoreductase domain-containing protein [Boletus coccyginus]|nr:NADP-dependent oxidoreductase domain-containing protein [Boletus coccyginus]